MTKLQFITIATATAVEQGRLFHEYYSGKEITIPCRLKGNIVMIFADIYGIPYVEDVTKLIRKYTSGQMITQRMAMNLNVSFGRMDFFMEEGCIMNLEKCIKKAGKDNGYT